MDRNTYYRKNTTYIKKHSNADNLAYTELVIKLLSCLYRSLEKVLLSDGFAAGFCGVALLLIIGIVGGIEFGTLSLKSGIVFSVVLLSAVGIIVYKKNRE